MGRGFDVDAILWHSRCMERKLAIYLETTMFNFPFADDAPDKKKAAVALFDEIKAGRCTAYCNNNG